MAYEIFADNKKKKKDDEDDLFKRVSEYARNKAVSEKSRGYQSPASTVEPVMKSPTVPTVSSTVGQHTSNYGQYSGSKVNEEEEDDRKLWEKLLDQDEHINFWADVLSGERLRKANEIYDPKFEADKQAIANAEAEARAQASVMKADAKATKSAVNDAKRVYVYDKHTGKVVEKSDKKENMLAANKQRVSDNKVRKANVKEAKAQAKAEAKAVVAPVPVFADFTELFDQAALAHLLQAELGNKALQLISLIVLGLSCQFQDGGNVVLNTHLAEYAGLLCQIANTYTGTLVYRVGRDLLVINEDLTTIRHHQTCSHIERRSLTRTIRAKQTDNLALLDIKRHIIDHRAFAVGLYQMLGTQHHLILFTHYVFS